MRQLLSAARSVTLREHLIVRIFAFVDCGPANYLRCAFEALKETEKGAGRIGETKTESSNAYVSISEDLQKEITTWLSIRNMADPYHRNRAPSPNDLLFPTEAGTPYRIGNYLKRILKPIAAKAGIPVGRVPRQPH